MIKTKRTFLFYLIIITYLPFLSEKIYSQNTFVQALTVNVVRSIGDTIIFGATDFGFMPDGSLLVCDKLDYKIKHLNQNGILINEIGKRGKNIGEFTTGPIFLAVGKSSIAVADYSSPRVQLFTHNFKFIREFRAKSYVMGMLYDSHDNLWIGTHSNSKNLTKLIKYNFEGNIISENSLAHAVKSQI